MGRKKRLELTRVQAEGQPKWRKIHHGKIYTFRGKYEDAVAAWHRTLVELVSWFSVKWKRRLAGYDRRVVKVVW